MWGKLNSLLTSAIKKEDKYSPNKDPESLSLRKRDRKKSHKKKNSLIFALTKLVLKMVEDSDSEKESSSALLDPSDSEKKKEVKSL